MIKKIKQILATLIASTALLVPMALPVAVHAETSEIQKNLCAGTQLDSTKTACDSEDETTGSITNIIKKVINFLSLIIGAVAVIMVIFGGFKYITSGGNDSNVSGAKNTILYAVIGLVIVALAQVIVRFVLSKATSVQ